VRPSESPNARPWLPRTGQVLTAPTANYRAGDDGYFQAGRPGAVRFVDNGNGTIFDRHTGLTWVKQPELIIPGAVGVHPTNQVQRVGPNYGAGVGVWVTASAYLAADLVTTGGLFYVCAEAHTSGVFATDLAAGKWRQTVWTASAADLLTPATMVWNAAIDNSLGTRWGGAFSYAGFTDWRLPNISEMAHLVDHSLSVAPCLNTTFFPNAQANIYSTGTTRKGFDTAILVIDGSVAYLSVASRLKTNAYYVRPVRGGRTILG